MCHERHECEDGFVCAQIAEANVTEALELALAWRRDEGKELPARAHVVTVAPVTVAAA